MTVDGANWYAYCRNNPVNLVDRDGQRAVTLADLGYALQAWGSFLMKSGYRTFQKGMFLMEQGRLISFAASTLPFVYGAGRLLGDHLQIKGGVETQHAVEQLLLGIALFTLGQMVASLEEDVYNYL